MLHRYSVLTNDAFHSLWDVDQVVSIAAWMADGTCVNCSGARPLICEWACCPTVVLLTTALQGILRAQACIQQMQFSSERLCSAIAAVSRQTMGQAVLACTTPP